MGTLKPGVTYVYESADGITYAREIGSPASQRVEIGRTVERSEIDEHCLIRAMEHAAKTNPAVRKALDRAILIYKMTDEYKNYVSKYG